MTLMACSLLDYINASLPYWKTELVVQVQQLHECKVCTYQWIKAWYSAGVKCPCQLLLLLLLLLLSILCHFKLNVLILPVKHFYTIIHYTHLSPELTHWATHPYNWHHKTWEGKIDYRCSFLRHYTLLIDSISLI